MTKRKRACLLTGASGKLGASFCVSSAEDYRIVAVYRRRPLAAILPGLPGGASLKVSEPTQGAESDLIQIQADLRLEANRQQVVDFALRKFGGIDLLVNGAVHSVWSSMLETERSVESAAAQFELNVIVPLKLSVLCARRLWRNRRQENLSENRNVINVSSIAGSTVYPKLGQGVYAATKAALNQLSRHMADEFSDIGVRVNALAPNSFPRILPVEAVVESLKRLDRGTMTGRILVLDRDGERYI